MRTTLAASVIATTMALTALQPTKAQQQGGQDAQAVPTFKSSVELVRVNAIVRDRKGRFVGDLRSLDFEVLERGNPRRLVDFRHETANVSLAVLFDVSGSMEARMPDAREAAQHLLSWLREDYDEAAVYTFDTRLEEIRPFSSTEFAVPAQMTTIRPFGATSLHDAVATTAEKVASRPALRRAVVVLTDGIDTASRLTAREVSGMASAIDVPVYILGVVPGVDNPSADESTTNVARSERIGSLSDLARWTGGDSFVVSSISERSLTARRIIDELRQQYLMAFEASAQPGWHPLEVKMRDKDLFVRARTGYIAGRTRPTSH